MSCWSNRGAPGRAARAVRPPGRGGRGRCPGLLVRCRYGRHRAAAAPLRVVFYGLYTPLQGAQVIGAALSQLAGAPIEVTMIGDGQDAAAAKAAAAANSAVRWLGLGACRGAARPRRQPPRLPRHLRDGEQGPARGAEQGLPGRRRRVRDRDLGYPAPAPHARRVRGPGAARRSGALAGALRQLAADPDALARLRGAASELAAGQFAPARIVAPLLQISARRRPPGPVSGLVPMRR